MCALVSRVRGFSWLTPLPLCRHKTRISCHSWPTWGELRKRIIFSVLGVIVGFLACWSYADRIFGLVQQPLIRALLHHGLSGGLVYLNPTELFNLYKPLFGGWVRCRTIHGLSIRALSIVLVHRSRTVSQGKALCSAVLT